MQIDLTFEQVCEFVKEDEPNKPKLIEAVDKLLGMTLICSPIVLGPNALPALSATRSQHQARSPVSAGIFFYPSTFVAIIRFLYFPGTLHVLWKPPCLQTTHRPVNPCRN